MVDAEEKPNANVNAKCQMQNAKCKVQRIGIDKVVRCHKGAQKVKVARQSHSGLQQISIILASRLGSFTLLPHASSPTATNTLSVLSYKLNHLSLSIYFYTSTSTCTLEKRNSKMSLPQLSLPQFIVMRSGVSGKYLCYGKGKGRSTRSSSLSFSHQPERPTSDAPLVTESLESAEALESAERPTSDGLVVNEALESEKTPLEFHLLKFEVEEAKYTPGFVHIRTCYNHKYLVRKSEESKSLVAEADEAEEDQSKWSCTLFKPVFFGEAEEEEGRNCVYGSNKHGIGMRPHKIQLLHLVKGEEEYCVSESMELIKKEEAADDSVTTLTISDVTATVQLPKYVTFKSNDGSKYMGAPNWYNVRFVYSDMGDQGVAMENRDSDSGPIAVRIYSGRETSGGFWNLSNLKNIILFKYIPWRFVPVKVNNFVALYISQEQAFLERNMNNEDKLSLNGPNITMEAQLQVGEPVLSRTILKITYDLDNARVYGSTNVTKMTDSRSNYTNNQITGSLSREFIMSETMMWSQSITAGMSTSMSMSLGFPKLGLGSEISISYDNSGTATWGEETSLSEKVTHVYDFDVPPMTMQTKSVVVSRGTCDVPFSCDVEDLLVDGTTRRYTVPDCWFTGANDYNANEKTYNVSLA